MKKRRPHSRPKSQKKRIPNQMNLLTPHGPEVVNVRSKDERIVIANHVAAVTKWRRGEREAKAALARFKDKTIAGYQLVTDPRVLADLEEAGELDFSELYVSRGGRG